MDKFYKIGETAEMLGVTTTTLRDWEKRGEFIPDRKSASGTRYYSESQIKSLFNDSKITDQQKREIIGYCRVSSHGQKDDLERQVEYVKTYMCAKGYSFRIITDIGSGINYNKSGLQQLISLVESNSVDKIVVLYKDRLMRFAFDLFESICKIHNTEIEIIDNSEKSYEEELVEDMIQIVTVFSCKLQGKRRGKTKKLLEEIRGDGSEDISEGKTSTE